MRASYGLPTHRIDVAAFASAGGIAQLTAAAELAGFGAVFCTEHPFPPDSWMARGGHHALDPMIALAVAATGSTTIRVHTNLFIPAYRNPFLAAKSVTTLDLVSGGRLILGVGAGYLDGEFSALGAPFETRNEALDETLAAMKAAWSGRSLTEDHPRWSVPGNTQLPTPIQRPHPPIWVGGNSRRAMRRAVALGDGWSPFPASAKGAAGTRTAELLTAAQLRSRVEEAHDHASQLGRTAPLDVCFVPRGLSQLREQPLDVDRVLGSCSELAAAGVTWVTVALPGDSVPAQLDAIAEFGEQVVPHLAALQPEISL